MRPYTFSPFPIPPTPALLLSIPPLHNFSPPPSSIQERCGHLSAHDLDSSTSTKLKFVVIGPFSDIVRVTSDGDLFLVNEETNPIVETILDFVVVVNDGTGPGSRQSKYERG